MLHKVAMKAGLPTLESHRNCPTQPTNLDAVQKESIPSRRCLMIQQDVELLCCALLRKADLKQTHT